VGPLYPGAGAEIGDVHGSSNKKGAESQVPAAHTYKPSYLGGRDQKNHSLKPAPGK
jgi:hypothetical protein